MVGDSYVSTGPRPRDISLNRERKATKKERIFFTSLDQTSTGKERLLEKREDFLLFSTELQSGKRNRLTNTLVS